MTKFCAISDMPSTLRASAAAGMSSTITLDPDGAMAMAVALDLAISAEKVEARALKAAQQFVEQETVALLAAREDIRRERKRNLTEHLEALALMVALIVISFTVGWF